MREGLAGGDAARRRGRWQERLPRAPHGAAAWLVVVIAALVAVFAVVAPGFLSAGNAIDLVEGASVTGILALGLFVVLVAGGIDISFAATASVAQYVAALAAVRWHWPPPAVVALGLGTGLALGAFNALLIDRLRATSIIITISTLSLYFALLMYFTGGRSIYNLPGWWSDPVVLAQWTRGEATVKLTLPIAAVTGAALLTAWIMGRTALGRQVYAMGGNADAARRAGIDLLVVHVFAYGWLGLMAAAAGLVQAHRVGEAVPNALVGGELFVLASAVLGGASLAGGTGSVGGVMLGVVLLAVLRNGLNLAGVSPYFFPVVLGLVVLASAAAGGLQLRRRRATAA